MPRGQRDGLRRHPAASLTARRLPPMVDELIRGLGLVPHPEGGFYKEMYRAALKVETPRGTRSASTAIYYLLTQDTFAAWHRVTSDEVWHSYEGAPLALYLVGADGRLQTVMLGRDVTKG